MMGDFVVPQVAEERWVPKNWQVLEMSSILGDSGPGE